MKPKVIAGLVLLPILLGLLIYLSRPRMPSYHGESLLSWLEQYRASQAGGDEYHRQNGAEATAALQHIGTNASPIYLRFMAAKPSAWTLKLLSHVPPKVGEKLGIPARNDYVREIYLRGSLGACGFQALGPAAKPYVPAITRLLQDDDPSIRGHAVLVLGSLGSIASSALPDMIRCVNDTNQVVRAFAVRGLGQIQTQPEKVVPILMGVLAKKRKTAIDQFVCLNAIQAIENFGPAGKPAAPMLLNLLQDPIPSIRINATNALKHIDLEAAAKAGIK